jgi:hypothetical protein
MVLCNRSLNSDVNLAFFLRRIDVYTPDENEEK